MTQCALIFVAVSSFAADPTLSDIVQPAFKDAKFVAVIDKAVQSELVKINKDFGTQYRFNETKVWIKEPYKLRLEAKVQDTSVLYVINGNKKFIKVPRVSIKQTEDTTRAPGKRQTTLDFGLLTSSIFSDPFDAKYVRTDRQTGEYVFDITYQKPQYNYNSRHRVWVDPDKRFTTKREWYAQDGHMLGTFYYSNPIQSSGVWFPTILTVKNVEGKLSGITSYREVAINSGLADSLFKIE